MADNFLNRLARNPYAFGVPQRDTLYPGEEDYFRENPRVAGMAAEDNAVILNPYSGLSDTERGAVADNEASRVYMRNSHWKPQFDVTPEQRNFFKGTAYENNDQAMRETVAARLYSGDPSAGNGTEDQRKFVNGLHEASNPNALLGRLMSNPYQPIDGASITRVDELGNGYDDWNNLIQPKFQQPEQTWGETALGVATAPARIATALADSVSPYGSEGWRMPPIIDEGVNALSAVGDAYNYGMDQDEINNRALGMAGFMMGGGGLAARPAGSTGMFAGRLAKTADQEALARAERMAAEGADRRAIWGQTGWFQGPDSKWRFEIDDSGSSVRNSFMDAVKSGSPSALMDDQATSAFGATYTNAENFINHPALFDAYPEARGVSVGASISESPFAQYGGWDRPDHIQTGASDAGGFRRSGLHELQHDIQRREGLAYGGTTTEGDGIGYVGQSRPDLETEYTRLAGETEARNVQKRMNMSADERRATPPWETQDIPDADQIVRLYSNASKEGGLLSNILGYFQGNKEPVTVRGYHGTRSEFDKFNGPSVYASENPDAASEWAMVANRDGEAPNVLPLDITASNPYYAKSLFPDQAELDRIAAADPDVVFYPPSTQHGTTFDKYPGQVFEARKPGTVRSATTGETLFSNASKDGAIPALLDMGQEARLARAREMGFDTDNVLYHGTHTEFPEFQKGVNTNFGGAQEVFGHFLTENPKYAELFSKPAWNGQPGGPQIMPLHTRGNFKDLDISVLDDLEKLGSHDDWELARTAVPKAQALVDQLKAEGYDGVRFSGVNGRSFGVADEVAVFDPRNIRSVNAAFDPAKSDSANLLAANADSRPSLLGSGQEQDIPDWLLPYLGR